MISRKKGGVLVMTQVFKPAHSESFRRLPFSPPFSVEVFFIVGRGIKYSSGAAQQQEGAVGNCQGRAASTIEMLGSMPQGESLVGSTPTLHVVRSNQRGLVRRLSHPPSSRTYLHVADAIGGSLCLHVRTLGDFISVYLFYESR